MIKLNNVFGFIAGISGLLFILSPSIADDSNTFFGVLLVLAAAFAYAIYTIFLSRLPSYEYFYLINLIFFFISVSFIGVLIIENINNGDSFSGHKIQNGFAINGTGGGNRGFDAFFINASTSSFSGLDYVDQGYGYFPVKIKKGETYKVSVKILDPNNAGQNIITSKGTNFVMDQIQLIDSDPSTGSYEFMALEDAEYVGFGTRYNFEMISFAVSDFSVEQVLNNE